MAENCSVKMKDVVFSLFMWLCCLPPSHARSVSLWRSVIRCGQSMCILVPPQKIHVSYASNFIWMTILPSQGLALSLSHTSSFLSSNLSFFFFFCYKNSPCSRSLGHPRVQLCSNYHNSYGHPLFFLFFAPDSFRDERCRKSKKNNNNNPRKTRTGTLSQNL